MPNHHINTQQITGFNHISTFKPYVIKNVGGHRIAVIGQAFPRTSNANPQKYLVKI
jgi:2',3'-cyclic-nucleotide 2'-phosphodiesterase (5'-nucleotidase family)